MYFSSLLPAAVMALAAFADAAPQSSYSTTSPQDVIAQMQAVYSKNTQQLLQNSTGSCTAKNIRVRKAYSDMSSSERTAYLEAARCLHDLPNQISREVVPGARNRQDDFTYSHLNQTNFIHNSGLLLPWHRQFVWAYEEALRSECGYTGAMPYWDWARHADNQSASPVFDGTPTSFGGNGAAVPHSAVTAPLPGLPTPFIISRAAGSGGGCVQGSGLGANFTVNIGPVSPANNSADNVWGLQYNPRCLKRDFLDSVSQANLTYDAVVAVLQTSDIHAFRPQLELIMHPNSHSFIGGDAFDLYTSPNDPVFFLLHGMIDRLWSVWQGQDYAARTDGLDGTVTFLNDPPSANATLDTVMHLFEAGGDIPIRNVMSTTSGQYCYMYV